MESAPAVALDLIRQHTPTPYFPVVFRVHATMSKIVETEKGASEEEPVRVSRHLYSATRIVGYLNLEKLLMAKKTTVTPATAIIEHPHLDLCVVRGWLGMKLPDVIPAKYGMVEIGMSIEAITRKDSVKETFASIVDDCKESIQDEMKKLAVELGGTTPFTAAEEKAAIEQARAASGDAKDT